MVFISFISTFCTPAMSQESRNVGIKDSLNTLFKSYTSRDTTYPKDSIIAIKDSAKRSLDSFYRVVKDIFGKDSSGLLKDSLKYFLKKFPSTDSLKNFFLTQLGWDKEKMNKDSAWSRIKNGAGKTFTKNIASVKALVNKPSDSTLRNQWKNITGDIFKPPSSLITIGGGYVNYNYMYRSALDTPFVEQHLGQHMIMAALDIAVADIPVKITYYGRRSNSSYLKDYNDFRAELNTPELGRIRKARLRDKLNGIIGGIQSPRLFEQLKSHAGKINELKNWLNGKEQLNKYLESKHNLAYGEKLPDNIGDKRLVLETSGEIVKLYEQKQKLLQQYEQGYDSLKHIYSDNSKKMQELRHLIDGNINTERGTQLIEQKLREDSLLDKKASRLLNAVYAIRTLAVGRTLPNMSNLTVKNLNVTGLDVEYNAGNLYLAATAGKIDFRTRDFLYGKASHIPQYVYAASIGYGRKEGKHIILTGFTGKKQIISNANANAMPLSGISIRTQWVVKEFLRIAAEVAQSTSPVYTSGVSKTVRNFSINDNTNKAYNIQVSGIIPGIKTRIDGYYQKTGINFQNFTNYRVNANASTWSIRAEQYAWKKQLRILASARKNDYSNPYTIQQYNSNAVFSSLSVTFRRRRYPSLTVGYMPASQYTIVNNEVVENRYQTLNATLSHGFRIGKMNASSIVMYNRFYNRGSDSGFLYYNANYFYSTNQFIFPFFMATIGYARTANNQYALDVMDGGLTLTSFKNVQFGFGVKINQYNNNEVRTGGYGNLRINIKPLGDITCWYESGYLPGAIAGLKKNEWFTLGFTRYFNNSISLWKRNSD
ncbi:MAG: hypothetical protein BGP13_18340 [Sphingobacteriales bacterium 40-81]|nr:MAG: hypothetical protein BGP13_18340 [Sphingobacteriales bacterium 40-81]